MSEFSHLRAGWQVKRLGGASINSIPPRGGAAIVNTSVGLILFAGANREQQAFDDLYVMEHTVVSMKEVNTEGYNKCSFDTAGTTDSELLEKSVSETVFGIDGDKVNNNKNPTAGSWKKKETEGDIPQPRSGHAAVPYGKYLFLFGGIDFAEESTFSDLYVLNLETWTWKYVGESGSEIEARNSHSLGILTSKGQSSSNSATIESCNYLVVFGGASVELGPLGDTFYARIPNDEEIDSDTFHVEWKEIKEGPAPREMHSTSICRYEVELEDSSLCNNSMIIAGGRGLENIFGDVWELTAAKNDSTGHPLEWLQREDMTLSNPRCAHGGVICELQNGKRLLSLVGGFTGNGIAEDITSRPIDIHNKSTAISSSWTSARCGAAIGARFGVAVCSSPKWLLDFKFPNATQHHFEESAVLLYGGINMEKDFGDVLLLLPPNCA